MEKSIKKYTLKIKPMEDEINSIKNQVSVMQQKYRDKVSFLASEHEHPALYFQEFFENERLFRPNFDHIR